jgi:alkyl hydroperoxide reductase subunit AhpC
MEKLPTYKVLYNQYKNKGFQIISISGDRRKDIVKWKKIIQDNQLNWQHVIDIDGNDSKKYNITTFPSTFLLDSKGRIIKMNFSTDELKLFLKENIE